MQNVYITTLSCHSARMRTSRLPVARQRKAFNEDDSTTISSCCRSSYVASSLVGTAVIQNKVVFVRSLSSIGTMKPMQMTLAGRPGCCCVGQLCILQQQRPQHQQWRRLLQNSIAPSRINDRQTDGLPATPTQLQPTPLVAPLLSPTPSCRSVS